MQIGILGPLLVSRDGVPVDVGGPKSQAVLITLAHHLDEVVRVDTLFEALWAGAPPKSARNVIQVKVSGLRRALGPSVDLRTEAAGYVLASSGLWVDAVEFERSIETAAGVLDDDPAQVIERCRDALALWRGDPAAELGDLRPVHSHLVQLRDAWVRAQSMLLDARLRLGQHRECCADAETLAEEHPFREDLRAIHLLALYRSGRQTEALAAFRRTRDLLVEELGVDPGPELQSLHRRILEQDDELDPWNREDTGATALDVALPRDNLRAEPNLFVERPEAGTVVDALHPGRVVTVVGAGGIGKSRCVAAVARRCLGTAPYADGVWIVDLAPLPEGSNEVAAAVAAALGLGQQLSASTAETIVDYLDNRRALLVLDNCEHVATAAAAFADSVAAGSTTTAVLAASRVRLGLPAESVITLERLPDDAAHRLLVARIAEAGAGPFADDECADLCAVLDNYPLAIELAAARTRALAPSEIARRLDHQPQLLTSPADTRPGAGSRNYPSLANALDWSLGQLSATARDTLDRSTVFVSDFDLATAETVLTADEIGGEQVVADLGELVEHSLISRDHGRARFRVLEPIRQHLRPRAPESVQCCYVDHFSAFAIDAAKGLRGPDEASWWDRIHLELPHVRQAVRLLIEREDVGRLDAIMAEMAFAIAVNAFNEPGEWAIDALRGLALDPIDAPGVAAAAAAQLAHLDQGEECDAILDPLQEATIDDARTQATLYAIRIVRDAAEVRWGELLLESAQKCGDPALIAFAKLRLITPEMIDAVDDLGNPTLRVFARCMLSASMASGTSAEARRNKEAIYRIALTSNNSRTIAEGQNFMALQHCFDQQPQRAGPLAAEMIERMVRLRSPHLVWHGVEVIANMLAMVRIDPFASEMLWAAVSSSGVTPFSRVARNPDLPIWVASQLTEDEARQAAADGERLELDAAARAARKAAERMSAAAG